MSLIYPPGGLRPEESACREIAAYSEVIKANPNTPYGDPQASIKETRDCGCELCKLILASLDVGWGPEYRNDWKAMMEKTSAGVRFLFDRDKKKSMSARAMGGGDRDQIFIKESNQSEFFPKSTSIAGYTGSAESLKTVIDWIQQCCKTHKTLCPGMPTLKPLPKRVLDVTSSLGESVRLVEISDQISHYVSLSHCWGPREHQPLRTTRDPDTLSLFKSGIALDQMPKTFRDAVDFTRKLGVQYLWIDSLCIIQDSKSDWEEQSSKMASIYRNAFITLSAAAAADGRQGLYFSAGEEYVDRPLSSFTNEAVHERIRIRKALPHSPREHPLMNRAWVFQERHLSPRVLHFGKHELIWECMEDMACECSGFCRTSHSLVSDWLEPKTRFHAVGLSSVASSIMVETWHNAVTDYSRMGLTVPDDILPALSGIAQIISEAGGGEYFAGLWKRNLAWDLCWMTTKPEAATRPDRWRAPTFSWASVLSPYGVSYDRTTVFKFAMRSRPVKEHIGLLGGSCGLASVDMTGKVKDGYILLSGEMIQATVISTPSDSQQESTWDIMPSGKRGRGWPYDAHFHPDYDYTSEGRYHVESGESIFCLKVLSTEKHSYDVIDIATLYLVLRKSVSNDKVKEKGEMGIDVGEIYERIGIYSDSRDPDTSLRALSTLDTIMTDVEVKII